MTTTALTLRREYLGMHRRLCLSRAIGGTIVALVPVPMVDDWLVKVVVGGGYRRLAASQSIDLDDEAIKNLTFGRTQPPGWAETTASAIAFRIASQTWKRFLLVVTAVRRAQSASRQFAAMTLFDHYCQRRHVGFGLDAERALELRDTIGKVISETPGGLSLEPFRRAFIAGARATAKAPPEAMSASSSGACWIEGGRTSPRPRSSTRSRPRSIASSPTRRASWPARSRRSSSSSPPTSTRTWTR